MKIIFKNLLSCFHMAPAGGGSKNNTGSSFLISFTSKVGIVPGGDSPVMRPGEPLSRKGNKNSH